MSVDEKELRNEIIRILETVYDPEIPVNIYELGLIYDIHIEDSGNVAITMTLTSPGCPVAGSMSREIEHKLKNIPEVKDVVVSVVWDPLWTQEMMSDAARLELGLF
ncbi:MAG TPA: DUF59 domain-containing protein [Bacteroidetes bacterium]|nr:DUF59 domain-containing protein [Bacteroidota bacterium]